VPEKLQPQLSQISNGTKGPPMYPSVHAFGHSQMLLACLCPTAQCRGDWVNSIKDSASFGTGDHKLKSSAPRCRLHVAQAAIRQSHTAVHGAGFVG
jgi:hypothetical protein